MPPPKKIRSVDDCVICIMRDTTVSIGQIRPKIYQSPSVYIYTWLQERLSQRKRDRERAMTFHKRADSLPCVVQFLHVEEQRFVHQGLAINSLSKDLKRGGVRVIVIFSPRANSILSEQNSTHDCAPLDQLIGALNNLSSPQYWLLLWLHLNWTSTSTQNGPSLGGGRSKTTTVDKTNRALDKIFCSAAFPTNRVWQAYLQGIDLWSCASREKAINVCQAHETNHWNNLRGGTL